MPDVATVIANLVVAAWLIALSPGAIDLAG
jgi:hypothetical protein